MMQFGPDGAAVPGSYAISTVRIYGALEDGTPVPFVTSAVCDKCGGWASELLVAAKSTNTAGNAFSARLSRTTTVVVYACSEHATEIGSGLLDEYGSYGSAYRPDDLAIAVTKQMR